jgi:hypothetical protein
VEKSGHELVLNPPDESQIFPVSGYTLGYVRDLSHGNDLDIGLGMQFTINDRPSRLDRYYGDDLGYALEFFCASAHPCTVTAHTTTRSTSPECKNEAEKRDCRSEAPCARKLMGLARMERAKPVSFCLALWVVFHFKPVRLLFSSGLVSPA